MKKKAKGSHKKKQRQFSLRTFYLITACVILLFVSVLSVQTTNPRSVVLAAATSSSQASGFSFGNFFASIFSFFSGQRTGSLMNNTANKSVNLSVPGANMTQSAKITHATQTTLTDSQLLAMAGTKYSNGILPLGDSKYVTDAPKKGYIYLCNIMKGGGGAEHAGSWLGTTTWTPSQKLSVQGAVSWPTATFSNTISGTNRSLVGNGLPVGMTTGTFPIQSTDPASQYDRNPNSIKAQSMSLTLPVNPQYSDTPSCMGGEVGVMLDGVALFNGFDADMRDAAAHEVQDSCDGHPESTGQYHYHNLSRCITNMSITSVIGFALDGFPITGPVVSNGKYLTTDDLDECHGITSEITLDGKSTTMYHYVMTQDFPYSVSCFRGKPVSLQVISRNHTGVQQQGQSGAGQSGQRTGMQQSNKQNNQGQGNMMQGSQGSQGRTPPQAAITACSGSTTGASCSFSGQNGTITGTCQTPPNSSSLACVPQR